MNFFLQHRRAEIFILGKCMYLGRKLYGMKWRYFAGKMTEKYTSDKSQKLPAVNAD
jgi:hypothetical protein